MTLDNFKKILVALLASMLATAIVYKSIPPSQGIISNIFVVTIISHFALSILGVLGFIFRIAGFIRRHSYLYVFLVASNFWLSLLELILYLIGQVDFFAIELALPNFLIGILLALDFFQLLPSKNKTSN